MPFYRLPLSIRPCDKTESFLYLTNLFASVILRSSKVTVLLVTLCTYQCNAGGGGEAGHRVKVNRVFFIPPEPFELKQANGETVTIAPPCSWSGLAPVQVRLLSSEWRKGQV